MVRIYQMKLCKEGSVMIRSRTKGLGLSLVLFFVLIAVGCHKNTASGPPPLAAAAPEPPPDAPTISLRAQPGSIDRGGSTTLQWDAKNATSVSISPGVGGVGVTGSQSVSPTSSVTYTATAMGPGGSATDTARITVNVPAAPDEGEAPRTSSPNVTTSQ